MEKVSMTWDELDTALNGVGKFWGDQMPMMAMEELAECGTLMMKGFVVMLSRN